MNKEEKCNKVSKKVMISQPMKGKTKEQIYSERESLVAKIEANGDTVVNTIFSDFTDKGNYPLKCLGRSFEVMADVDKVIFMEGWQSARGCRFEFLACTEYGIPMEFEKTK